MLPAKTTRRKFYNKWSYKTTLSIKGIVFLRNFTFDETKNLLLDDAPPRVVGYSSYKIQAWENRIEILDLINVLSKFNKDEYAFRIERNSIDLYTNNKDFYDLVNIKFERSLKQRFEPATEFSGYLEGSTILVKKLPQDRYNYRVYLKPHIFKGDKESKISYLKFLKDRAPHVSISDKVKDWFIATDWNWDRRYILVEDEKTLLMLKLRNSEVLGTVYRFIIPINTECPQKV